MAGGRRHKAAWMWAITGLTLAQAGLVFAGPPTDYRLVFADEFNGTSVDTSKWNIASPSWTMPNSLSTAAANKVSVGAGALTLTATRTGTSGSNQFSSGSVSTYNKYNFSGGYAEASINLPSTPGSWPAFWGLYNGWPPETDIMEYPLTTNGGTNGYTNDAYHTAYHYSTGSGNASGAGKVTTGQNLSTTGYHIFAMDWVANTSVKFYLDGNQVSSYTGATQVAQMVNMYMILDYAVGGWPGTPSTAQWAVGASDETKVDWLRVWQKNPNADADSTWNVNGGGSFITAGNWTGGGVPNYGNQTAIFGRNGTAATATITMDAWQVMGGITFNGLASGTNAGTTAYTLGSSSNAIQLAGEPLGATPTGATVQASSSSTVSQNINAKLELWSSTTFRNDMTTAGQTLNLNSEVSGSGVFNVSGVGAVVLNAANTYTGGTNVGTNQEAAVLRANASNALGTGGVVIGPGGNATTARLEVVGGSTLANNIDFKGRLTSSVGIESVSGNNTLSGTITSNTGGNIYLIQSDAGTFTLSGAAGGATVAGVALQSGSGARTFTLQGAGDGFISGKVQNGGAGTTTSIAKSGPGTWTLTGANSYTGSTSVGINGGKLVLANTGSMSSISIGSGATLSTRGTLTTSGALTSSGTLDLVDTGIANVNAASLSLTSSTLNLQLGAGTAADKIAATGAASGSGNTINFVIAPGQSITNNSAHTILTAASGVGSLNFAVGTKPVSLGFYNFTLSSTSTALTVTVTGNATPATAFWTGAGSAATPDGVNNSWGAGATVSTSNWSTDLAGAIDAKQLPGSTTDVQFTNSNFVGSGVFTTRLDDAYAIKGLTLNTAAAGITSTVLNTNGNALMLGVNGLTLAGASNSSATISGAGSVRINGSQNWANQSNSKALNVSSGISAAVAGATTLTFNGTGTGGLNLSGVISDGAGVLSTNFNQAGTTILSGINTYTGGTTVAGGIVEIFNTGQIVSNTVVASGGTLRLDGGIDAIGDAATVDVQTGGVLDVRDPNSGVAKTETFGSLNGGGTVTRGNSGTTTLTLGSTDLSGSFSGTIQDGSGVLKLVKTGGGTQTLAGHNTYSGGTTIAGGIINAQNDNAFGTTGIVNQASGNRNAGIQLQGGITIPGAVTFTTSNDGSGTVPFAINNVSGDNRINGAITLTSGGGGSIIQSDSGALTIAGNINIAANQTSRGIVLQGASTAANTVSGIISDLSATSVNSVTKNDTGAWTLAGNNNYSGGTTVNGGTLYITGNNNFIGGALTVTDGTAVLTAANTYTGGTVITGDTVGGDNGGSVATGGHVVMADKDALGSGNVFLSGNATLEVATDGNDHAYNFNVGTNNTVNLMSGVKTGSTGINHTLGTLLIGNNDTVNVTAAANVTGGSPSITFGTITLTSGFGAGSTVFNPTTANLTLGGVSTSTSGSKTLVLDGTATANFVQGVISNGTSTVSVQKDGAGTWTLTKNNTYTGTTTVNGGTLLVNGNSSAATGNVTVASGGTLGGIGTVGGITTVNGGGNLAPGSSPGVLTFSNSAAALTLASGSTSTFDIAGTTRGGGYDGVTLSSATGALTYGGTLTARFTATVADGSTFDLFAYTASPTGNFSSVTIAGLYGATLTNNGGVWTGSDANHAYTFTASTGDLNVSAVPEPSSMLLVIAPLGALLNRRRRKN